MAGPVPDVPDQPARDRRRAGRRVGCWTIWRSSARTPGCSASAESSRTTRPIWTSRPRNPYLAERPSGDLVGDAVKAAARRGIRVMGRMDFSKIDHRRAEAASGLVLRRTSTGDAQVYNGLTSVCPSGDYYQVKLFEVSTRCSIAIRSTASSATGCRSTRSTTAASTDGVCHCLACSGGTTVRAGRPCTRGRGSRGTDWQRFSEECWRISPGGSGITSRPAGRRRRWSSVIRRTSSFTRRTTRSAGGCGITGPARA